MRTIREALPIDAYLDPILETVRKHRALVLTAEPGAGKTTRVAPVLSIEGPLILLQPRRVAARAIAARIAAENGWMLGREIGWQVRFDRRYSSSTRLLVATEGILTARLQSDPLLSGFRTIILDEFHERSVHADLALALSRQAWRAREDLNLVVMSATLDTSAVSAFLDNCPVILVPGRLHPVEISYAPQQSLVSAIEELLTSTTGQILCFLPGAPEIRRAYSELETTAKKRHIRLVPLHGSMEAEAQDAAIRPSHERRVILATNIAETSLTVPGVTTVVDTGLHKVARFNARRGLNVLVTERIPQDAATQRAGRAGRLQAGLVCRLWDPRDLLRAHREPEIQRIDLSGVLLDVLAWGGDPDTFEWFEAPPSESVQSAWRLLEQLGGVTARHLTALGDQLRQLPLPPRLGCILVAARGACNAAQACALLSEWRFSPAAETIATCDLFPTLNTWSLLPKHIQRAAREIERAARILPGTSRSATVSDNDLRRAIFAGYPDCLCKRRAANSRRFLMCSGHGATLAAESSVHEGEFLVALDMQTLERNSGTESLIRLACLVDREWIESTGKRIDHRFDTDSGQVKAVEVELYGQIPMHQRHVPPDPEIAAALLTEAILRRGLDENEQQLARRLRFAGIAIEIPALVQSACCGASQISDVRIASQLPLEWLQTINRLAPQKLHLPSGRWVRLDYSEDGSVSASVKLQELFGLAETPRIGLRNEPILMILLAPNGRAVQQTRDLRSFWERGYPQVRKELRGRYPRHPWPEDPWSATPTSRAQPRRRKL